MSQNLVMRQLDERQLEHEVSLLVWSPKMDILALALANGAVALFRLQWQRVWTAAPFSEGRTCSALCWRPDGKLLASGDSGGLLTVRHIESSVAIHEEQLDSKVTCCTWLPCPQSQQDKDNGGDWEFLAKLPSLAKTYSYVGSGGGEELEDCRKLDTNHSEMSVLLVGTQSGSVYVLVNGYLKAMRLVVGDLLDQEGEVGGVESLVMAADMKTISLVLGSRLVVLKCPLLATCQAELAVLADKFSLIHGILGYMRETIGQIREAWETILLEMDTKLASYAENNPPGTVAADFLELLMFGVTSPELEHFLHKEMSEKGLKKLGHSIELSYSNIQRLVLKYLGAVSQSLNFHLGELLGLARAGHKYSVLGVTEEVVEKALYQAMAFWSKGVELQQVIDESMKNFKAFFRWVYVEILKLGDETVSGDLSKVSQQDITFIAEFLQRFQPVGVDHGVSGGGVSHVYLERVGQYLADAELVQPPDNSANPWHKLLAEHPEIQEVPFIIPVNTKTSIVQEHSKLSDAVGMIFSPAMGQDLAPQTSLMTSLALPSPSSCRQLVDNLSVHGLATIGDRVLVWRTEESGTSLAWLGVEDRRVVDTSFYTKEYLSLLLEETGGQKLVQMPLSSLTPLLANVTDLDHLDKQTRLEEVGGLRSRDMDGLLARQLAVSGPRKVSVFLFKNRKRLRIYDMEGEEEEDYETLESSGLNLSEEFNTSSQMG